MRSLFLRILLWFGVAMVLAAVASFVIGVIAERRARDMAAPDLVEAFEIYSQTAVDTFDRDGGAGLAAYLERIEHASGINAVLINERGIEVSGRTPPVGAQELARRALEKMTFVNDFSRGIPLNAHAARSPNGAIYVLVGQDPGPARRPGRPFVGRGFFRVTLISLIQRLLPVLLIGGLFCYWLARHLSSPLTELRGATRELAEGRLTARVDEKLLKRRDEIGLLGRDFNLMAGRIESLVEAQRRLLGDISHELRSPLARQGVALGLARRRSGPEAASALDRIEREGERLNEMIGQLLALSRLESGTDGLKNVKIDLSGLIHEVVDDADFEARSRERSVRVVQDEPAEVFGVPELIRSAVENVVRNAVRHTEKGTEVNVSLVTESVNGERLATISVFDHGKGVPENSIAEIFRPFYRVEDARDRTTGGTGLGLSIAARAVRLHHGTINASNARDGGLIVEIRLPIRP